MSSRVLLLFKRDCLWLTDDFSVSQHEDMLYDARLHSHHVLSRPAAIITRALAKHTTYAQLLRITHREGVAPSALQQCLIELDAIGAFAMSRQWRTALFGYWTRTAHLRFGIFYARLAHRHALTVAHLGIAVVRATQCLWISIGIVCALLSLLFPRLTIDLFQTGFAVGLVTMLSLLAHETSHMIALGRARSTAVVLQRGSRVGIVHQPLAPSHEIFVALIGPCIGSISAWLTILCYPSLLFAVAACGIGILHLCSLMSRYGDGASLRRAIQQKGVPQ